MFTVSKTLQRGVIMWMKHILVVGLARDGLHGPLTLHSYSDIFPCLLKKNNKNKKPIKVVNYIYIFHVYVFFSFSSRFSQNILQNIRSLVPFLHLFDTRCRRC